MLRLKHRGEMLKLINVANAENQKRNVCICNLALFKLLRKDVQCMNAVLLCPGNILQLAGILKTHHHCCQSRVFVRKNSIGKIFMSGHVHCRILDKFEVRIVQMVSHVGLLPFLWLFSSLY